jgi:Cys-tRNA(Pro)/Cys-tRNA(Cys) deacylase
VRIILRNNVTRLLDQQKIKYKIFEVPDEKLGTDKTADILGVELNVVFKTIVVKRPGHGKNILSVVPGDCNVDLKKLARAVGEKKVYLTTQAEAEKLTQLLSGGISPLALINRGFQVVLDQSALEHAEIHVSGGQRGMNIRLPVGDLVKLTRAQVKDITRKLQVS